VVRSESDHLAGYAINPDSRAHVERVPLYARLKLLKAIVGEPDGAIGKNHRR
jgi:hypothetical protein